MLNIKTAKISTSLNRGFLNGRVLLSIICLFLCVSAFGLFLFASTSGTGLKIYYLRHAEGGHNVKKDWEERKVPESEWPDYVGNPNMFTPKGQKQLLAATKNLQNYEFNFIATSPMWRTRNTILPYLKVINGKSEIWPELHETSGSSKILSRKLPKVKDPLFGAGDPIEIPEEEAPYFNLIEGGENEFKRASRKEKYEYQAAVMKLVLSKVINRIEDRFGDSGKSILLVGHGGSGKGLLKLILQSESVGDWRKGMGNAVMWMVEQQDDGSFKIKMYNGKPIDE